MKFFGILNSHIIGICLKFPELTQTSKAPYNDIRITIGITMQQDTAIAFERSPLSGFTRKRKANPFAGPETKNQSQSIAAR